MIFYLFYFHSDIMSPVLYDATSSPCYPPAEVSYLSLLPSQTAENVGPMQIHGILLHSQPAGLGPPQPWTPTECEAASLEDQEVQRYFPENPITPIQEEYYTDENKEYYDNPNFESETNEENVDYYNREDEQHQEPQTQVYQAPLVPTPEQPQPECTCFPHDLAAYTAKQQRQHHYHYYGYDSECSGAETEIHCSFDSNSRRSSFARQTSCPDIQDRRCSLVRQSSCPEGTLMPAKYMERQYSTEECDNDMFLKCEGRRTSNDEEEQEEGEDGTKAGVSINDKPQVFEYSPSPSMLNVDANDRDPTSSEFNPRASTLHHAHRGGGSGGSATSSGGGGTKRGTLGRSLSSTDAPSDEKVGKLVVTNFHGKHRCLI